MSGIGRRGLLAAPLAALPLAKIKKKEHKLMATLGDTVFYQTKDGDPVASPTGTLLPMLVTTVVGGPDQELNGQVFTDSATFAVSNVKYAGRLPVADRTGPKANGRWSPR